MPSLTKNNKTVIYTAILCLLALVFFAGFLTQDFNIGFLEWRGRLLAPNLQAPNFFHPQHLLHLPFLSLVYRFAGLLGYTGEPVQLMQFTNALFGVFSVAIFFRILVQVTENAEISLLAVLGWMFTYGTWKIHTEAWYEALGMPFILLAIWLLLRQPPGDNPPGQEKEALWKTISRAGRAVFYPALLVGIAILFGQIFLFYLPGFIVLTLLRSRNNVLAIRQAQLWQTGWFLFIPGSLTLATYYLVSALLLQRYTPGDFLNWILKTHGSVPGWFVFNLDRVIGSIPNLLAIFVPINEGIRLRALFAGAITPGKTLAQVATLASLLLIGVFVLLAFLNIKQSWRKAPAIFLACLVWMLTLAVFGIWNDPVGLFVFFPLFAVWIVIALTVTVGSAANARWKPWLNGAMLLLVLALFLANFSGTIYPDHAQPSLNIEKARITAQNMGQDDVFITYTYDWSSYMVLFRPVRLVQLFVYQRERPVDERIQEVLEETCQAGSQVFIVDATFYPDEYWEMLPGFFGVHTTRADFERLPKTLAWKFSDGETVWQLTCP